MKKILENVLDKIGITIMFIIFCIVDLYILAKGYYNVYKEKYFNRK